MAFRSTILIVTGVFLLVAVLIGTNYGAGRTVVYDCRMAEFHPDFPPDVREQCRKMMREQVKRITT